MKNHKQETTEDSVSEEAELSISDKTKRIKKSREQAKDRKKSKLEVDKIDKKFIPEGFDDPSLDEHTKKKMIQMIRNRVSAQASRDKKKVYLQQLERDNMRLQKENSALSTKYTEISNKLKILENSYAQLAQENEELKKIYYNLTCHNCGTAQIINQREEYPSLEEREETLSENSSSGITRISRRTFTGGFFNIAMTFATILSVVLMVFMGNSFGGNFDRTFQVINLILIEKDHRILTGNYLAQPNSNIRYFVSEDAIATENCINHLIL